MVSEWNQVIIINGLLITALYTSSLGLVFYQKWYLKIYSYPFFATAFNQLARFLFSSLYRMLYTLFTGEKRVNLSWWRNCHIIVGLGFVSGIHMALSNWSLHLNTMSLFTVSKSTSVIFVLFFGILMDLEKKSFRIITVVFMISFGLALFTYKFVTFNPAGFVVAIISSFMGGLRWTYTQYIMQNSDLGLDSPFDIMYYIDIWASITSMPLIVFSPEGAAMMKEITCLSALWEIIFFSAISAVMAFLMEVTKYVLIRRTSSLTETVLGIAKEIATLVLAYLFLDETMSIINFCGLVLCLGGVICHSVFKFWRAKKRFSPPTEGIVCDTESKTGMKA